MRFAREGFVTTGRRRFRTESFPMRLYQKAKKLGIWDPYSIDLSVDKENWPTASDEEKDAILGTISLFQAGEESVTLDILPLMMTVAREGRIEEELFLTTFLFEEGKHVEFFQRFLHEVVHTDCVGLDEYHTPSYRKIFYEELPQAMWSLSEDPTPANQIRASVTYNMIVEGVLAETGYFGFDYQYQQTGENLLPGLLHGIGLLRRDESRHIAYGIYLISRLLAADPSLWDVAQERMMVLLPLAMAFINERLQYQIERFGHLPHDLQPDVIMNYAASQYQKRFARLQKARSQTFDEIELTAVETEVEAA